MADHRFKIALTLSDEANLIPDKADRLLAHESVHRGKNENNVLSFYASASGFSRLRDGTNHSDDDNNHTRSHHDKTSARGRRHPGSAAGSC
jgi:hypothetical protein